jgi:hypothetical protein
MNNQYTGEICPNFSHRFAKLHDNHLDLVDTISLMTGRASAVLCLIALQFESEDSPRMSDDIIYSAIDSVIAEIQDVRSYAEAFAKLNQK